MFLSLLTIDYLKFFIYKSVRKLGIVCALEAYACKDGLDIGNSLIKSIVYNHLIITGYVSDLGLALG